MPTPPLRLVPPDSAAVPPAPSTPGYLLTADASPVQLRALLRQHLRWVFGFCAIAASGLLLPSSIVWFRLLAGVLEFVGLGLALVRVLQVNGIVQEIRRRTAEPDFD